MKANNFKQLCALLCLVMCGSVLASPQEIVERADYIGVDYSDAIKNGVIINHGEYAEMQEFSKKITQLAKNLKLNEVTTNNIQELEQLINQKAQPNLVAMKAREISLAISQQYGLITLPKDKPQPEMAKALYQQHCASCHGDTGHGDGPLAGSLTPKPTDFHDFERAKLRSISGLYNTITSGVAQTSMTAFKSQLTEQQRWDLAFYVGQLFANQEQIASGEKQWQQLNNKSAYTLEQIISHAPSEKITPDQTIDLIAYLRSNPQVLWASATH
ncbi:MAG: cytochrome c [Gammaproteobacteria bacterium]